MTIWAVGDKLTATGDTEVYTIGQNADGSYYLWWREDVPRSRAAYSQSMISDNVSGDNPVWTLIRQEPTVTVNEAMEATHDSLLADIVRLKAQRIELLEFLALVAEYPGGYDVSSSRMCDEFDAAMIRHGHYTYAEVNDAREKAVGGQKVDVNVIMTRSLTIPRSILDDHEAIWRLMDESGLTNAYLIDTVEQND